MDTNTTTPNFPYAVAEPHDSVLAEHLAYLVNRDGVDKLPADWADVYATGERPFSRLQLREMISYFS